MAINTKTLSGIGKSLLKQSDYSVLNYTLKTPIAAGIVAGVAGINVIKGGFEQHNKASIGRITGAVAPARMTGNFTSGGVEAMQRVSKGNYQAFSEMANKAMTPSGIGGKLETYGATPELVSALYGMGGM